MEGDIFFFYTSTRHWLVGPDYNSSAGCIHSKDMFLETIPVRGWQFDAERFFGDYFQLLDEGSSDPGGGGGSDEKQI